MLNGIGEAHVRVSKCFVLCCEILSAANVYIFAVVPCHKLGDSVSRALVVGAPCVAMMPHHFYDRFCRSPPPPHPPLENTLVDYRVCGAARPKASNQDVQRAVFLGCVFLLVPGSFIHTSLRFVSFLLLSAHYDVVVCVCVLIACRRKTFGSSSGLNIS